LTLFDRGTYTHKVTFRRAFRLALVAAAVAPAFATAAAAQSRQRSLYVSVVDQAGAPVPDLGPADFLVKEDAVTREVLRVTAAEEPMQIAVLVDTSQSAREAVPNIRDALPAFVATMTAAKEAGRRNEVAIIGIGERPTILSEYSMNPRDVQKGIDRIWPLEGSGMYLLDAILEVCQGLRKREALRPVVVAIATEGTDFSNRQHDQVMGQLKESGAAFYALMIGPPSTSLSIEARERAIVLDEGPRATGGAHEQLLTSLAIKPKLAQLANQLTHQYKVTYARPESLIPPEHVSVSAAKPGLVARGTPIKEPQVRP
jgi:VWA domain-containing protein